GIASLPHLDVTGKGNLVTGDPSGKRYCAGAIAALELERHRVYVDPALVNLDYLGGRGNGPRQLRPIGLEIHCVRFRRAWKLCLPSSGKYCMRVVGGCNDEYERYYIQSLRLERDPRHVGDAGRVRLPNRILEKLEKNRLVTAFRRLGVGLARDLIK